MLEQQPDIDVFYFDFNEAKLVAPSLEIEVVCDCEGTKGGGVWKPYTNVPMHLTTTSSVYRAAKNKRRVLAIRGEV